MRPTVLPAIAFGVAIVACMPPSRPFSDADRASIRATSDTFTARVLRADWAGASKMYSTDARFMPPNQPIVVGRAAIETWMHGFPPLKAFKITVDTIAGSGDLVYTAGHYTMTFQPAGAPTPINDNGKFLEVHARQTDGTWLNVSDMFNSDQPAMPMGPAPKPAMAKHGMK